MISDQQRREVAQNLRAMVSARSYEIPERRGSIVDIDDLLTELLDRRVYCCEESVDSSEATHLADIICPTCRNVGPHDYFCCSRCKFEHPIAAKSSTDGCGKPVVKTLHFNYRPSCGAEVVNDA
nr:MAG TPA: DNA gyrase inhibitor [Caudoviricetes sp.]